MKDNLLSIHKKNYCCSLIFFIFVFNLNYLISIFLPFTTFYFLK